MDIKQVQSFSSFIAFSAYVASVIVISGQVKEKVPSPYMDEIFHVGQAKTYCAGNWSEWDDKITTPPGLYIVPAVFHRLLPSWFGCSTDGLRWTNGFLLCLLPLILSRILSHFRTTPYPPNPALKPRVRFLIPEDDIILEAIVMSCFPIAYFSGFLFYTDLASLLSVLACYDQSLVGNHFIAGLMGIWSCLFRQTNVVWVAFIAGSALVNQLKGLPSRPKTVVDPDGRKGPDTQPLHVPLMGASPFDIPRVLYSLIRETIFHLPESLSVITPYLITFILFAILAHWNGGIVLGDQSNHRLSIHIPQLYYFSAFSAFFLSPVTFDLRLISRILRSLFGSYKSLSRSLVLCALMVWTISKFTYEHPFLLSDNRHYTFYVWRWMFKRYAVVRYLLIPCYMVCMKFTFERLARSYTTNLLVTIFYAVALGLILIPPPLIEPRYFLVPYILLRSHVRPVVEESGTWPMRLVIEGCLYGLVNLVTLSVFLYRPFKSRLGEWEEIWQRFMW